ncbi:hypothetical protein B0H34DRAFT_655410 [Crassisporium funariophilum]|nr:hypothetical protein B0H34DRAFT_655410 [Crassisporium funariophilum]
MSRIHFCREDLLILLGSMGISLPKNTKIPDEDLVKRLANALDAAQHIVSLTNAAVVDPSTYPSWSSEKTLLECTRRGNALEAYRNAVYGQDQRTSSAKEDTFIELRQVIMSLANGYDNGHPEFFLLGDSRDWGVFIRILKVVKVNDDTPLFLILYKELRPTANSPPLLNMLASITEGEGVVSVKTTDLERSTMLKLFHMNSRRLASREDKAPRKLGLRTSFTLPLGPLSMYDRGKLTNNSGCEVCGKTDISRCVQCLSVAYCSKECQKDDWKQHKGTCRSLKGGTWQTITFARPADMGKGAVVTINRLDSVHDVKSRIQELGVDAPPPPDIHHDKIFLVKFQISLFLFKDEAHMLIYDRQKSFEAFWRRKDQRDLFDEAEEELKDDLKMYRWARRVGDYQLSVCLNRSPAQNPAW